MDSFEFNKIAGAILATCLFLVGLNLAAGFLWNVRLELTASSAAPQNTIDLAAHLGGLAAGFFAGCGLSQPLTSARSTTGSQPPSNFFARVISGFRLLGSSCGRSS